MQRNICLIGKKLLRELNDIFITRLIEPILFQLATCCKAMAGYEEPFQIFFYVNSIKPTDIKNHS
jgi:hypothetical protein